MKRHSENVAVYWPGQPEPTRGRHTHHNESVEFFKAFDNHLDNDPYKILFGYGDYTCSVARWIGKNIGPFMGPDGRMIPATNKKFELEFCTVTLEEQRDCRREALLRPGGTIETVRRDSNSKGPNRENACGLMEHYLALLAPDAPFPIFLENHFLV